MDKLVTLKKNREFSLVYNKGRSFSTRNIVLIYLPRKYGQTRIGLSVSKKVGKSVVRNKKRRQLKECFRYYLPMITKPAHIVFIARTPISKATFQEIKGDMGYLLRRFSLLEHSK